MTSVNFIANKDVSDERFDKAMHSDGKSFHRPWKATSKAADKLSCIGNKEKQERAFLCSQSQFEIFET